MRRVVLPLTLVFVSVLALVAHAGNLEEDILHLQQKLLAPCCYKQILQIHESPQASALRREIRKRLAAGESPAVVEEDIVRRFGPEVRAIPKDFSLGWFGLWPFAFAIVGGAVLMIGRARRAKQAPATTAATADGADPVTDDVNDRIDEELDRVT